MEQGSPKNTPSSSSEQGRIIEDLAIRPPSYLALLMGFQNTEPHQIGPPFSGPLVPFSNSNLNTEHAYSTPRATMLANPTPLRLTGNQGIQNPIDFLGRSNGGSNYSPPASRHKRKTIYEDDIAPNPGSWTSSIRGDQRYSSASFGAIGQGYTMYDQRYQAIGLPVDPHLRIFNAINGQGSDGSTSKKN